METECPSCEVRTWLQVLLQVASISQLTVSRLSRQCGILNISQRYRPPRPVTRIALLYFTLLYFTSKWADCCNKRGDLSHKYFFTLRIPWPLVSCFDKPTQGMGPASGSFVQRDSSILSLPAPTYVGTQGSSKTEIPTAMRMTFEAEEWELLSHPPALKSEPACCQEGSVNFDQCKWHHVTEDGIFDVQLIRWKENQDTPH
jgi:hypothetical protein